MKDMVEGGHVYVAQPPLYSTEVGKEKVYLKDDLAKDAFMVENPKHRHDFQRLKGLGEMDAEVLATIDAALAFAEASPPVDPLLAPQDVYAE